MPDRRLFLLAAIAALAAVAFMTVGAQGNWGFVLPFRGTKLIALIVVAVSIAVSTLIFQTLCSNRILTPSIVGFDWLFILLQTALIYGLGGIGYVMLPAELAFGLELGLLGGFAMLLFGTLLGRGVHDLFRMLLIGVVLGVLFRSLTRFLERLIDPSEFAVVQSVTFARFNSVDADQLTMTSLVAALCIAIAWRRRARLDVMALGREHAVNLGLDYGRELRIGLALVSALVAASTALVGPVALFGLLISALTYWIMKSNRHGELIVAASLISVVVLVGGQTLFERGFGMAGTLGMVIDLLGGLVFLTLVLRQVRT